MALHALIAVYLDAGKWDVCRFANPGCSSDPIYQLMLFRRVKGQPFNIDAHLITKQGKQSVFHWAAEIKFTACMTSCRTWFNSLSILFATSAFRWSMQCVATTCGVFCLMRAVTLLIFPVIGQCSVHDGREDLRLVLFYSFTIRAWRRLFQSLVLRLYFLSLPSRITAQTVCKEERENERERVSRDWSLSFAFCKFITHFFAVSCIWLL